MAGLIFAPASCLVCGADLDRVIVRSLRVDDLVCGVCREGEGQVSPTFDPARAPSLGSPSRHTALRRIP